MLLTPDVLLSAASRQQCVAKVKELPTYTSKRNIEKITKEAAVLIPLCVDNDEVCLLYTLRSSSLTFHRGQVCFPGGMMDENEDVIQTATRETEEEIGFLSKNIDIWAKMPRMTGQSSTIFITPVVGLLNNYDRKNLKLQVEEVTEIFTVSMNIFCNKKNHGSYIYKQMAIPVYSGGKHKVWGITGMITHLFLKCFLPKHAYQPEFTRKTFLKAELTPIPNYR